MGNDSPTREIFCANDQQVIPHILDVDNDGAITAECSECGRVLKFATTDPHDLNKMIADHFDVNQGQVTLDSIDELLDEIAD